MISLLSFRALPFVVWAIFSSRRGPGSKALWFLGFVSCVTIAIRNEVMRPSEVLGVLAALAYFAMIGLVIHDRASRRGVKRASSRVAFVLLATACLVLPALLLHSTPFLVPALVVGWEVMLSGYSYCIDSPVLPNCPGRAECLFFLLVNPALVYPERGATHPGPSTVNAAGRCVLGIAALAGQDALVSVMGSGAVATPVEVLSMTTISGYVRVLILYCGRFAAYYFAQSGLASVRIGLAELVGYAVPECFRHPYLATGPQDFWQRWNVWVGGWARRYLFFPVSLALRRTFRRAGVRLVTAVSVMATFLAVGLLHDIVKWLLRRNAFEWPPPKGLVLFGLSGIVLLLWIGCGRLLDAGMPALQGKTNLLVSAGKAIIFFHVLFLVHAATLWLLPGAVAQPGGW